MVIATLGVTQIFAWSVKIGSVTAWRVEDIHALIARISGGELADLQIEEVR